MKAWIITVLVGLVAATAGPVACAGQEEAPAMRVLVLTGEDNAHDWEANSDRIMELWEDWGVTDVERQAMTSEEAWVEWDGDYADYDAVVHMYYTAGAPAGPIEALADYVTNGGALVVVHSALAGLQGHEAFDELIGVGWRGSNYGSSISLDGENRAIIRDAGVGGGAAHPPLMEFQVHTRARVHPITEGLPAVWMQGNDELYYNLRGPVGDMDILATAQSPNEEYAPMLWTRTHGEGRIFVTALGHHLPSIESVGFMTTLTRGLEWAVTGGVTTEVPSNFPGPDEPVLGSAVLD